MSLSRCSAGIVLFSLLAFSHGPALAQDKEAGGEKIRIPTIDGVDLHATFFSSKNPKVKNPPVIIMLHPLGENSTKKPWVTLAESLRSQATVVTFDFRGHGQSTDVDPQKFWSLPLTLCTNPALATFNATNIKGGQQGARTQKATIEFKEFTSSYYPALINDISAVRCYLDRQNDAGKCNTSSIIVLGAETGATLGAIWVNSEWHRHRMIQNPVNLFMAPDTKSEGRDIIGCVWLSPTSQLGNRTVSFGSTLDLPLRVNAVPMVFMYGEEDKKGAAVAAGALKFKTSANKAKYTLTDKVPIPKTDLTGIALLQKSLGVDKAIAKYLDDVIDAKGREWTEREFRKSTFSWRPMTIPPGGPGINAKLLNENNLLFDTYSKYIR
jgi:hypothetical protein